MAERFDLVVIGAGSGGVRAARLAATYGAKVAIIEEYRVGGTCVIRGCVPKKLFVYASRFSDLFDVAGSFGWQVEARFDWPTLVANKDREIARLEAAYVANLESRDVEIIRDRAVLTGPREVRTVKGGRSLEAERILVATGGHPVKPDMPGAELGITSNEAFHLERLPRSILIVGAGYIGIEFATVFSGLGVDTTVIYRGDRILRGFDEDVRRTVEAGMQERQVRFIYETTVTGLTRSGNGIEANFSDGTNAPYGAVMFATGRTANVTGFGLQELGVALTEDGTIAVDETFRTSVPSIFAIGDVNGGSELTPVAIRQGAAFAETQYNANPTIVDLSILPTAVFGEPEVGTVGLTEEEAATHGDIDVYVTRFRPMMNTMSLKSARMLVKLITTAGGGRVLGCHLVGPGAAEMIQLVAIPMGMGATKADFDRTIALHPTAAEEIVTLKTPACIYRGGRKTKT